VRLSSRATSFLVLCALAVPMGIAVHLWAEYVGLGDADEMLVVSARHAYLALLAAASLCGFLVALRVWEPSRERRRRAALLVASLPANGRGPRFFAAMLAAQIGFFYVTQFGEGCPLCAGDLVIGLAGALLGSVVCALVLTIFRRRIVRLFAELIAYVERYAPKPSAAALARRAPRVVVRASGLASLVRPNRPPPLLSA
jgi:hypothetical protein